MRAKNRLTDLELESVVIELENMLADTEAAAKADGIKLPQQHYAAKRGVKKLREEFTDRMERAAEIAAFPDVFKKKEA